MYEGFEHAVTHFPTILIAAEHTNFHLDHFKGWLRREIRWNMDVQIIRAVLWTQEHKVRFEEYNVVPAEHWLENPATREPFTERKDHQGTAGPEGLKWPEAGAETERKTLRKEQGPKDFIPTMTREFWERTTIERRRKLLKAIARTGTQYPAIVLADDALGFGLNDMKDWLAKQTGTKPGLAFTVMSRDINGNVQPTMTAFMEPGKEQPGLPEPPPAAIPGNHPQS